MATLIIEPRITRVDVIGSAREATLRRIDMSAQLQSTVVAKARVERSTTPLFPIHGAKVPSAIDQTIEAVSREACLSSKRLNRVSSENLPAPKISTMSEATRNVYGAAA